jgi:hypothetical protein
VFEVYPGVRVAPDEDSEEEGAQRGGEEHHHQPEESLVTRRHQRSVVQPGTTQHTVRYGTPVTILLPTVKWYLVFLKPKLYNFAQKTAANALPYRI